VEYKPCEPPYEQKYPLNTLKETIHEDVDHLMHKRVEETTPDGKIILTYDEGSNTFLYWSQKPIAYRYLEVVARKYVIVYNCKHLYINMYRELIKAMNPPTPTILSNSPFATFKSYNTLAHKRPTTKIANEIGNQYKHVGKELPKPVVDLSKPISFVEYKKNKQLIT